jgi:hypothetical protein
MSRAAKISLLVLLFAVCGAGVFWQYRSERLGDVTPPSQLYDVVVKQMTAFRSDDFAGAYRQVSSNFQERFNIEAFAEMAHTEYPGLLQAGRVEFGAVHFQGRHAVMPAYFFLPGNDVIPCVYSLVREDEAWKIDGVRVLRRWPAGRRLSGTRM